MEEKRYEARNSIWAFFGRRFFNKLFSGHLDNSRDSGNNLDLRRGFTLIELIIVITMIGILSTALIVLINPQYQIQRANDGRRKSELKQIQAALEIFRSDVGGYPGDDGNNVENSGNSLVNPTDATIIYLQSVPKDPRSGADYFYCTQTSCGAPTDCASSICSSYALYACSEQGSKDSEANNTAPVPSTCSSGTGYYYKVLSP